MDTDNSHEEILSGDLIAFTGGGSAGHVTPNIALIELLKKSGGTAMYIGRGDSVESKLIEEIDEVCFLSIPSERLRRYFHWGNFIMPLIVLAGIVKSAWLLWRKKPRVLFSKGGFVSLPVVIGAWLNRIPVIIHESDGSLGLANRLSLPFTDIVCLGQQRALASVKHRDVRVTGSPLRADFFRANPMRAREQFNLAADRPLLIIFGGSLGAQKINEATWGALAELVESYEIVHVVGEQHYSETVSDRFAKRGYHQFRYISEGFADLLSAAHIVVCRAGANAIAELVALRKPSLLIPLSSESSRGDQAHNAESFCELGGGVMLTNESLDSERLLDQLNLLESQYSAHLYALEAASTQDSAQQIMSLMTACVYNRQTPNK